MKKLAFLLIILSAVSVALPTLAANYHTQINQVRLKNNETDFKAIGDIFKVHRESVDRALLMLQNRMPKCVLDSHLSLWLEEDLLTLVTDSVCR